MRHSVMVGGGVVKVLPLVLDRSEFESQFWQYVTFMSFKPWETLRKSLSLSFSCAALSPSFTSATEIKDGGNGYCGIVEYSLKVKTVQGISTERSPTCLCVTLIPWDSEFSRWVCGLLFLPVSWSRSSLLKYNSPKCKIMTLRQL